MVSGTTISVVSHSKELISVGLQMHNCLHQYVDKLRVEKNLVLVKLERNQKLVSVAELAYIRGVKKMGMCSAKSEV